MENLTLEYIMGQNAFQRNLSENVNPYQRGPSRYLWFQGFFNSQIMAKFGHLFAVLLILCGMASAGEKDVPDVAPREIARRGNQVELTGTIRSGLMAAALAPPEDDSAKWFVTLVYQPGEPVSEKLRKTIQEDRDIRAWVDFKDPLHSFTHYQERAITDPLQRDWLAGLSQAIERYGLPMVVIQPPRNNQFGPPATIVKCVHGDHSGKDLSAKIREGIVTYVTTIESQQPVAAAPAAERVIGVSPPFVPKQPEQPKTDPLPTNPAKTPFDWPDSKPAALTMEEIQAACPGATPEFVLESMKAKASNAETLGLRWQLYQQQHKKPDVVIDKEPEQAATENPFPHPAVMPPLSLLAVVGISGLLLGFLLGLKLGQLVTWVNEMNDARNVMKSMKQIDTLTIKTAAAAEIKPQS